MRPKDDWSSFTISGRRREDVKLWQIFRRRALFSLSESSVVLLDYRISKVTIRFSKCVCHDICPEKAGRSMKCAHETALEGIISSAEVDESRLMSTSVDAEKDY